MADLISGLGGAAGFGDNILDRNDDLSTGFVDLTTIFENGLNFFGTTYTGLYINNNGNVTFFAPRSEFTPSDIVSETNNPEIDPFFADVDTSGEPTAPSPGGTSQGTNLVYYSFDTANDRFVVTWDDVGYYQEHTDKVNAFQLVLTDLSGQPGRGLGDFTIDFRYENIDWTTGDASGGTGGLGGEVARAGYSAGQGTADSFFELPQSGDQNAILALDTTPGNTGEAGLWSFIVTAGGVDSPPLANPDSYTYGDDRTVSTTAANGVLANDSDADGDALTAALVTDVAHGTLSLNADGSFTYVAAEGYFGPDSFAYVVSDGRGGSDTATVSLNFAAPIDNPPLANPDSYTYGQDRTVATTAVNGVLANDSDPDGDALTAALATDVAHGTLSLNPDGSFTYVAAVGYFGPDSFTYLASDGRGGSGTGTVSLNFAGSLDNPPVANPDSYTYAEDRTVATTAANGVLANDSDADGDPLSAALVTDVAHGTLSLNADGSFTYVAAEGYFGPDSFTYLASDGRGGSSTGTVSLDFASTVPHLAGYAFYWYSANSGDYYYGTAYDDGTFGYAVGQTVNGANAATESGSLYGYYLIYDSFDATSSSFLAGQVTGDASRPFYHDGQSGQDLARFYASSAVLGNAGLGSESDYAFVATGTGQAAGGQGVSGTVPPDNGDYELFGMDFNEADAITVPPSVTDSLYFYYAYNTGSGDVYWGQVYDDGTYGYSVGLSTSFHPADDDGVGYTFYDIYDAVDLGVDSPQTGFNYVTSYFDGETGTYGTPAANAAGNPAGTAGLGSEFDTVDFGAGRSGSFGLGFFEADPR
jgi:VCBS repeat-containing protein